MMNAGVIPPEQGYLEGVREVVHAHDALLAFDEVKCGVTTSYGGATGYLGVQPDMVCLAKAMGGGVPCGAIGGTEEVMGRIADGTYEQVGTFNGNPLTMAAARATLTEILTPEAYDHFGRLAGIMVEGSRGRNRGVRPRGLPAVVRGQRFYHLLRKQGAQLPGFPGAGRPFQPGALALPAQRRRFLAAVGQGRAVDALGAALRGRRQALRRQLRSLRAGAQANERRRRGRTRPARETSPSASATFEAVRGIDLDIPPASSSRLLGPSGCGKTTTLRMIAGFERPSAGRILLDGRDVSDTPPNRRNVNTVFQSYALFSHLTVVENVAFGLRFTKTSKRRPETGSIEALSLVQMRGVRATANRTSSRAASSSGWRSRGL